MIKISSSRSGSRIELKSTGHISLGPARGRRRLLFHWTEKIVFAATALGLTGGAGLLALGLFDKDRGQRRQAETARLHLAAVSAEEKRVVPRAPLDPQGIAEINFANLEFQPLAGIPGRAGWHAFAPQAPARVSGLDDHHVRITGYLLPTRGAGPDRQFLILANQSKCCYGINPRFSDYIIGSIKAAPMNWQLDTPLVFEGTLHVRDIYDNGIWSGLYSMDCTAITRATL